MSAALAGAMRPSTARETVASGKDRCSAMIDDLEELMLLIDAHRRGVAGLVAEAVKDVVDALRGRIDRDIDARLRRLAGDGRAVADRLAEASDRAVSRAVSSMLFCKATSALGMPGVSTFGATGVTPQPASARPTSPAPAHRAFELRIMFTGSPLEEGASPPTARTRTGR